MSHQLESCSIRAFRRLRDLELRGFGGVNLLVGANNSGKTSVLEALSVFCRPLDPLEWIGAARRREIKSSREPLLDTVQWLFPHSGDRATDPYFQGEILIEGTGSFPNRQARATFQGILGSPEDDEQVSLSRQELEDDVQKSSESGSPRRGAEIHLQSTFAPQGLFAEKTDTAELRFQLWEDERFVSRSGTTPPYLPVTTLSPVSHRVELVQVKQLSEATLIGAKFSVMEAVRLIDSEIFSLEILSRYGISPTLWIQHRRTGYSPLSTLGDGVRRVLTMALNLIDAANGVLFIDEIETAIHTDALVQVFSWLVQAAAHYNVQLFVTTHSLEAVDALLKAENQALDELVAFRLPAPRTDQVAVRYSGQTLHELRYQSGMEVR